MPTPWVAEGQGSSVSDCINRRPRFLDDAGGEMTTVLVEVREDASVGSLICETCGANDLDEEHSVRHAHPDDGDATNDACVAGRSRKHLCEHPLRSSVRLRSRASQPCGHHALRRTRQAHRLARLRDV